MHTQERDRARWPAAPATALEIGHAVTVEILRNTYRITERRTALALGWCRRSVRAEQATIGATVQGAHGGLHVLAFGEHSSNARAVSHA